MTLREFYIERRKAEHPGFMKVLQALPKDRLDYAPDPRSPSAQQIVWTLVRGIEACVTVVTTNQSEWNQNPPPPFDEMVERFERASKELADAVALMGWDDWDRMADFYSGGRIVTKQPVGAFLWFILFDGIHHRGQLTTYIRPMGAGKVPAIYGPSADERPPAAGERPPAPDEPTSTAHEPPSTS